MSQSSSLGNLRPDLYSHLHLLTIISGTQTRVRSTGHGISAGLGKLGAVIAQVFFAPMIKRGATHDNPTPWIHGVMQIFALFMFLGCLTSLLVPEGKTARLEELAGEREDVYELQFRSHFYTGSEMSPRESTLSGRQSAFSGRGMDDSAYVREGTRGHFEKQVG